MELGICPRTARAQGTYAQDVAVSSSTTLGSSQMDHVVLCTGGSGGITLTLPANASWHNSYTSILKVDSTAGICTIAPGSGDAINLPNSGSNYVLSSQWQYVTLLSNGSGTWEVIGAGPSSGGESGPAIQTGGTNNSSQSTLNFINGSSGASQINFSNPSGGEEEATLANTSTTVNGQTCTLGSSCTVSGGENTQTASYTLQASDVGKLVVMNCSSACTVTLYGSPANGYYGAIESIGSTVATVSLNSKNYNGSSSVPVLLSFMPLAFWSDGSNYFGEAPPVAGSNITFTPSSNGLSIAASGGGGGGTTLSGSGEGYAWPFGHTSYPTPPGSVGANNAYAFQFVCCDPGGVSLDATKVAFEIGTTSSTGYVGIAVYSSGSSGSCGSLLGYANFSAASSGAQQVALSTTVDLTQGDVYWLAWGDDSVGVGDIDSFYNDAMPPILQQSSYPREVKGSTSGTGSSMTWPSSCSSWTVNSNYSMPVVALLP